MIIINDKEYRNLEEQVQYNNERIERFIEGDEVLGRMGIKVVGQVATEDYLPNPATYTGEFGDAYLVGDNAPYDYYIYTRPFEGQEDPQWFNLGQFPVAGPKGESGPAGATGPAGKRGSQWFSGTGQPNTTTGYEVGDIYVNTETYNVWHLHDVEGAKRWLQEGNIRGPQGPQGIQGKQGPAGPAGPQGQRGPQGLPGSAVNLIGILSSVNQLPEVDAEGTSYSDAYLVGPSSNYHLWYIGGYPGQESTWTWKDAGPFNAGTVLTNYVGNIYPTYDTNNILPSAVKVGVTNAQTSTPGNRYKFRDTSMAMPYTSSSYSDTSTYVYPYIDPENGKSLPSEDWKAAYGKTPAIRTSTGDIILPSHSNIYEKPAYSAATMNDARILAEGNVMSTYKVSPDQRNFLFPPMFWWFGGLYDYPDNYIAPETLANMTGKLTGCVALTDKEYEEVGGAFTFGVFDEAYGSFTCSPFSYIHIDHDGQANLKQNILCPVIDCGYSDEGFQLSPDNDNYFLNNAYYVTFLVREDQLHSSYTGTREDKIVTAICPFYIEEVDSSEGALPTGSSFEDAVDSAEMYLVSTAL